ncbi:hypothetical protein [Mesorhizobium silamurunense]|uniref:hypothetical protein n=1 Tax=Mesorhizobium silamurunense TaxID=499528 RepID=UPI001783D264|nr:hypothetical protein [Mesorhizobium silamurunense]
MSRQRALTILNEAGDQTIVWDESSDDTMTEIIRKKMAQGIQFFIIEPRFFGLLPPKRTPLTDADEARKHRALAIKDEDIARFVGEGGGDVVKTPDKPVQTVRKAKNPEEVAKSESVGVKPMRGG